MFIFTIVASIAFIAGVISLSRYLGIYAVNGALLSRPARDIIRFYRALPVDNRVGSLAELYRTLHSLDIYNGGCWKVNEHFLKNNYSGASWDFGKDHWCDSRRCGRFSEYDALIREIHAIHESIAQRNEAIRQSSTEHAIETAKSITERLRDERRLMDEVTKEISQ